MYRTVTCLSLSFHVISPVSLFRWPSYRTRVRKQQEKFHSTRLVLVLLGKKKNHNLINVSVEGDERPSLEFN